MAHTRSKKQHTKMNSMINLPDDVLINNILFKLDTKSLGNLRCVCKYLQSFIGSSAFLKMHCDDQLNNHPSVLLVSGNNKSLFYSLNFNSTHCLNPWCLKNVKIASGPLPPPQQLPNFFEPQPPPPLFFGSCNGLICLAERENSPPIIWNPTTRDYKPLPPPPFSPSSSTIETRHPGIIFSYTRVVAYGLGYDSIIDDYKVIRCESSIYSPCNIPPANNTKYTITDFHVYTLLGTDDTWRRINDNPYESYFIMSLMTPYHYKTPGMFVNGALHWILREKESFGSKIIAYDIEKEMFRAEVPKPHDIEYWSSLHVLKGCLCIYERLEHEFSPCIGVWMMKDYGVIESWTILFTIDFLGASLYSCLDFKVLKFCENGEVIVARDEVIVYDPINRESRKIEEIPGDIFYKEIHIESLASVNKAGIYRGGGKKQ